MLMQMLMLMTVDSREAAAFEPATSDVVINRQGNTYDSHPSAVTDATGRTWVAWHAYADRQDRIMVGSIKPDGALEPATTISSSGTVPGPPTIVALNNGSICVVWSARIDQLWQVFARQFDGTRWLPAVPVSGPDADAIYPTASVVPDHGLIVAWSQCQNGQARIVSRLLTGQRWQSPATLSSQNGAAFRPVMTVAPDGTVWAFWDEYDEERYGVVGRSVLPALGSIERVSPVGQHCLTPTAAATPEGLCVAWLRKQDVMGGPGVVSQWHTLHAAIRRDDSWDVIIDAKGSSAATELTQGLVAKIQPNAVATGGYLGRRTTPMIMVADGQTWLMWERKKDHRGRTPDVAGDLVGRTLQEGVWQPPVVLHSGYVDYHPIHSSNKLHGSSVSGSRSEKTSPGEAALPTSRPLVVLASQLPRNERRLYHRVVLDPSEGEPMKQDEWPGWRPVQLPVESELTERREIELDGETFQLYWADMHCHSGLTADAEGEHDELTYYARDKARLDIVVFTNNDFLYDVPLTEYEYALGNFFAGFYSRRGKFLSLPGYEWTSRVPGVKTASVSDPRNWTSPYQNRSFPNHRSVVYPPAGGPVIRFPEVANDIQALNAAVESAGGVTFTQHDAFEPSGHAVEVAMELTSGWRNYIARVPNLFHQPLLNGARLGFVANGDSHRRAPGLSGALTGIYAKELTAESVLDALRKRRCFATNGARIFVDARANGVMMGQETAFDPNQNTGGIHLTLTAIGTRPIESAVLIRDGEEIRRFAGGGTKLLHVEFRDREVLDGQHWYYWRISQRRAAPVLPGNLMAAYGHLAWSTPNWVVVKRSETNP